ncbi:MAG: hypothetical protein AAF960_22630 [Bacteroidota bacterium]
MRNKLIYCLLSCCFLVAHNVIGQPTSGNSRLKQRAHQKQLVETDYATTENKAFLVHVYANENKAFVYEAHHWFLDLKDPEGNPINQADIKLTGYLKANPEKVFPYIPPVFSLCNEGRYIIGFVEARQSGPWVLNVEIEHQEVKDAFTQEIVIPRRVYGSGE